MPRAIPELSIQSSEQRACPLELIFYWVETDYHSKPLSARAGSERCYEKREKRHRGADWEGQVYVGLEARTGQQQGLTEAKLKRQDRGREPW